MVKSFPQNNNYLPMAKPSYDGEYTINTKKPKHTFGLMLTYN